MILSLCSMSAWSGATSDYHDIVRAFHTSCSEKRVLDLYETNMHESLKLTAEFFQSFVQKLNQQQKQIVKHVLEKVTSLIELTKELAKNNAAVKSGKGGVDIKTVIKLRTVSESLLQDLEPFVDLLMQNTQENEQLRSQLLHHMHAQGDIMTALLKQAIAQL